MLQQKTLKAYLEFKFKNLGSVSMDSNILTHMAMADKVPNRTVGLKFEKIKTAKPKIIVVPVISIALPVESMVCS